MRLEIYNDVYKWLIGIQVLQLEKSHAPKNNGKTEIDEAQTLALYSGIKIGELLSRIDTKYQTELAASGHALKDANTPTARLYNWNVLTDRLRRIGVELDSDIKQLIVGGDLEMVAEVLRDIYQLQKQKGAMPVPVVQPQAPATKPLGWDQQKKELRVDQLTSVRPLHQTESILEFVLLSLCHNMSLKPVQAQQLLANNNKLLAHICQKGVKGQFAPVIKWLQEVYSNWGKLVQLCDAEEVNIQMVLNVLKTALFSKEDEVVLWALRIYTKLASELANQDKLFHVYQWAIRDSAGLQALIQCHQRQPHLAQQISEFMLQIARYDVKDLFENHLSRNFDSVKTALEFLTALLPYLTSSPKLKDSLIETGLMQTWLDQALKAADNDTRDHRMSALGFLTTIWSIYPNWMDLNVLAQNQIMTLLQKASHDHSQILKIYAIVHAFKLLDSLAQQKIYSASQVYRKLTFILIENYEDYVIREIMFKQLKYLLAKYPSIPVDTLIEPIVKNVQTSYNISDLQFFTILSTHPNLKVNSAIMLLDCLIRIYNTSFIYANAVLQPIQQLIKKFIERPEFQDFVAKMAMVSMQIYQQSVKNKRTTRSNAYQLDEESTINAQKRALIIELMKFIITLHSYSMNQLLKPILVAQHLELKTFEKQDNKGVMVLLTLLGNPDSIIEDVVHTVDKVDLSRSRNVNESELFLDKKLSRLGGAGGAGADTLTKNKSYNPIYVTQRDDEDAMVSQLLDEPLNQSRYQTTMQRKMGQPYSDPAFHKKLSPIQNDEWKCVYPEGDLEYVEMPPVEFTLVNFDEEEDVQKQTLELMVKFYQKTLRYLFERYAVSEQAAAKKRLLQKDYSQAQLRIQDVFRMLRDYEVQDFTNYEEVIQIVTTLNKKPVDTYFMPTQSMQPYENGYNSMSNSITGLDQSSYMTQASQSQQQERTSKLRLDLPAFGRFMSHFAMIIFSRKPMDKRQQPAGQLLQELFRYFSGVARRHGENSLIFDDPDGTTTVADKITINKWNLELALHPEIEVPVTTHLRKVPQEEVVVSYGMKRNVLIGLKDNFLMCYELVNDIISSKFKTSFIEPKTSVKVVQRVKPLKAKGNHKDQPVDQLVVRQENLRASLSTVQIREKPTRKPFFESQLNKSLEMSISPDSLYHQPSGIMSASTKIVNKYKQLKEVESQEMMISQELKQQKWQKHKDYLDKQHSKIKDFKFHQELERVKQQRDQIEAAQKKDPSYYDSAVLPVLNKKLEKVKKYKSELFQSLKTKEEIEQKKQKELEEKKLAQQKQFFKNVTKHEMDKMKASIVQKRATEAEEKTKQDKEKEKQKAYVVRAGSKKEHYEQLQQKKVEFNKKFKALYKDAGIQTSFKNFAKRGRKVFKYFTQYSDTVNQMSKRMNMTAWMEFTRTFGIQPEVLSEQQAAKLFQKTLDAKNHVLEVQAQNEIGTFDKETGITYFELEFTLLRLAIKAQGFFNKLVGVKDKQVQTITLHDWKKSKVPRDPIKRMAKIDDVKAQTLEGMFTYLEIPEGHEAINARLRHLQNLDENLTKPRLVLKDVKKVREEEALPGRPKERVPKKDWHEPGTHVKMSKEEKEKFDKEVKDKEEKRKRFPFIKKHQDVEKVQAELQKEEEEKKKQLELEDKKKKEAEERKKAKKEGKP